MEKDIRKLNRKELLEILLEQSKLSEQMESELIDTREEVKALREANFHLKKEKKSLKEELDYVMNHLQEAVDELDERKIIIQEAGSLAEASLKINNMFEDAQRTVDDYVINAKRNYKKTVEMCENKIKETEEQCKKQKTETEKFCEQRKQQTEELCKEKLTETRQAADEYWEALSGKLTDFYNAHAGIKELLASFNINIPDKDSIEE